MKNRHCHELIAKTAREMAATAYEERASHSNEFYQKYPSLDGFVEDCWGHFLETARHTLATLLGSPTLDEVLKEQIADALIKDNSLRRGRHFQIHPSDL